MISHILLKTHFSRLYKV